MSAGSLADVVVTDAVVTDALMIDIAVTGPAAIGVVVSGVVATRDIVIGAVGPPIRRPGRFADPA
ncbi:hypothetical protein FRAHR75_70069 [Frankia sp. Hr75.2]|nr:hypothetical protein FRAHR75_70069 [Frankia sp. Hr75.2]